MAFKAYQHIERITNNACEGILDNYQVICTAKIDGTNASIWMEDGKIHAGSRTREITPEKDNAGFAQWVYHSDCEEMKKIRAFLKDNPDFIIYGEWTGDRKFVGNIKDYNQEAKHTFFIFDMFDKKSWAYYADENWRFIAEKWGLEDYFVPILAVLDHPTVDDLYDVAQNNKFLLDNTNHPGEGIVVKVPCWRNKYGHQQYGKLVLDEYVQEKKRVKAVYVPGNVEQEFVEYYLTNAEMSKAREKVLVICGDDVFDTRNKQHVGRYINLIWKDLIEENILDALKRFKNPTIDFAMLKGLALAHARKFIGL